MASGQPIVQGFFDPATFSVAYVAHDPATHKAAVIDPVWNYDAHAGVTSTWLADDMLAYIRRNGLTVEWILDTHPHADHFSAALYFQEHTGAPRGMGDQVVRAQQLWQAIYNDTAMFAADGRQWDKLFADGERFRLGELDAHVIYSPGHTLVSVTYVIGDAAFVHDTLFQPDFGTARCDFPGGDAKQMWHTLQRLLALPEATRTFTGHDYQPGGRQPEWESSIGQQKRQNPHLQNMDEAGYVALREKRDAELPMPKLILQALQVNLRGGRLPEPESNGVSYLKVPVNQLPHYQPKPHTR